VDAAPAQARHLPVELVDQLEAGPHRLSPRLRDRGVREPVAPLVGEQMLGRAGKTMLSEGSVDAVPERGAVMDEMQPEADQLPLAAFGCGSQTSGMRSRRTSSPSTCASILSVLHASGARPFTLTASGRAHLIQLELIVDKPRAPLIDAIAVNTAAAAAHSDGEDQRRSLAGVTQNDPTTTPPINRRPADVKRRERHDRVSGAYRPPFESEEGLHPRAAEPTSNRKPTCFLWAAVRSAWRSGSSSAWRPTFRSPPRPAWCSVYWPGLLAAGGLRR
jgi:hypothetical protein